MTAFAGYFSDKIRSNIDVDLNGVYNSNKIGLQTVSRPVEQSFGYILDTLSLKFNFKSK